jgi:hypothetical protein
MYLCFLFTVQMLPPQFYIYCLLPELLWWAVAHHWAVLWTAMSHVRDLMGLKRLLMLFIFYVIGIEVLVSNALIYSLHSFL